MYLNIFLQNKIVESINKAKKDVESKYNKQTYFSDDAFSKLISENFDSLNFHEFNNKHPSLLFVNEVKLTKETLEEKDVNLRYKSIVGSGLVIAGQPLLKKRFIMKG